MHMARPLYNDVYYKLDYNNAQRTAAVQSHRVQFRIKGLRFARGASSCAKTGANGLKNFRPVMVLCSQRNI